jgi:hypothetical protein
MFGAYHLATSISDSAVTAASNDVMLSLASQHLSKNLAHILKPEEAAKVSWDCFLFIIEAMYALSRHTRL